MKRYAAIVLTVLLLPALPACSSMDRWMNSSGGGSANTSTAMNNTSINPNVINDAANPANLYFGD
ncbi:MAG: hypothetical protein WBG17_12835 [Burkholderiaceae bacterium]